MLKWKAPMDKEEELFDIIECLERSGIAVDTDQGLERVTFIKWQETAKLAAPKDSSHWLDCIKS